MSEQLIFWVGNRNPSIVETITSGGSAVDLSSSTVKFQAREVGATALLVDAAVSNSPGADGVVRYDWSATDIQSGGILYEARHALVWWRVTTSGKTQDMSEALIEVRDHSPAPNGYVELEQLKSTLELTGQSFADEDLRSCILSASRDIDEACGRKFYLGATAAIRYYTPDSARILVIDDLVDCDEVAVDRGGDGTFEETLTLNTDFVLEPLNASSDSAPWEYLRTRTQAAPLPVGVERSVRITGQFGWSEVPAPIQTATRILASRLFKRSREAPFGIVTVGSEATAAMRLSRTDPDVASLIAPYVRHHPFI